MSEILSNEAVAKELSNLDGWSHENNTLVRTWELKGFNGAVQVANVVAYLANQNKHHPDIAVHDYNQVTVKTTTHDAGGVTANDVELARQINTTVK